MSTPTFRTVAALATCLLLATCKPPQLTPAELQKHYDAHATEKMNSMVYMGSDEHFHHLQHLYLTMQRKVYRISRHELTVPNPFPLSDDPEQWREFPMRPSIPLPDGQ